MRTRAKLSLSLTVVAMVLGFMVTLQYRQTLLARVSDVTASYTDGRQKELADKVAQLERVNKDALKRLQNLNGEIAAYEKESAGADAQLTSIQQNLSRYRILAGTTPVEGPGISVTLMDGQYNGVGSVSDYTTHDWEVNYVINELFTAGAEAVSINNYRVVANSGIFCIGPVITVNNHRLVAPFQIQAIGDPAVLKGALEMQGGILDLLRNVEDIKVSAVKVEQNIQMPAFTAAVTAPPSEGAAQSTKSSEGKQG
ncbi:DUF881 domain-containing protein [Alicyclobacillus shizuokensis]|uniref:DUF881 domain-containing protein n=1 Tax=Alicyclobacillus shizuokensis TaxID=392014 RepID=UPI00082A28E3|nr:DUF881 domain-containing protein [Alicyclobacillus shizuokensis]MCL6627278.1 DUF881 domain-containing protein [Alicyclobacillus shizuokensis]